MGEYSHKRGIIKHNAIEALLHDPLFRQRIVKNKKGKGHYQRKNKHCKAIDWEVTDKMTIEVFLSVTFH